MKTDPVDSQLSINPALVEDILVRFIRNEITRAGFERAVLGLRLRDEIGDPRGIRRAEEQGRPVGCFDCGDVGLTWPTRAIDDWRQQLRGPSDRAFGILTLDGHRRHSRLIAVVDHQADVALLPEVHRLGAMAS